MNDKEAVVAALRRMMTDRQYKNLRKGRTGGYFNGVLNYDPTVNLRPGRIWIREGEDGQRAQSEALIVGVVDNVADIPVWLAETIDSNELVVLGPVVTTRTLETWGGGLPGTGVPRQPSEISSQLIRADNITVGRIGPSTYSPATLYVTIGVFWHNNRFLGGIEYDVGSGNLPGSAGQYRWAFICVDDDNNAYTVTGTAAGAASKSSLLVASAADIAIPAGYIPVGLVSLAYGQTAISDSRFEDPRNWIAPRGTLLSEDSATLTIASGAVTVGSGSFFVIAAESGTADNLDTITASGIPRDIRIQADSGDTITVKHSTGNIELNATADFALSGDKTLALFWDGSNWADTSNPASTPTPLTVDAVFTQYEAVAVSNTVTTTTLVGNGLGSATLPANTLQQGTVVRIKYFTEQDNATSSPTCTIATSLGGAELSTVDIASPSGASSGIYATGEVTVVCTTAGASGEVSAVLVGSDGSGGYAPISATTAISADTTGTLAIDITATWSAANAGNIITLRTLTIEVLNP